MKWHKDLYTGESILHKQQKVKWKIVHGVGQIRVYVITLASNGQNLLDIIPARELLQKHYPKRNLYVIGLAGNYQEALEVAGHIINEVYGKTGDFDVRGYIQGGGKQGV